LRQLANTVLSRGLAGQKKTSVFFYRESGFFFSSFCILVFFLLPFHAAHAGGVQVASANTAITSALKDKLFQYFTYPNYSRVLEYCYDFKSFIQIQYILYMMSSNLYCYFTMLNTIYLYHTLVHHTKTTLSVQATYPSPSPTKPTYISQTQHHIPLPRNTTTSSR
jgi:hypothetical protein